MKTIHVLFSMAFLSSCSAQSSSVPTNQSEGQFGLSASPGTIAFASSAAPSQTLTISLSGEPSYQGSTPVETDNCSGAMPIASLSKPTTINKTTWQYTVTPLSPGSCTFTFKADQFTIGSIVSVNS